MNQDHPPTPPNYEQPLIEPKRGVSMIWLLPLIALAIAAWLLYKSFSEAGVNIYITFDSAEGIEEGKTRIIYKGLTVGMVKKINISKDMSKVTVMAEMVPDVRQSLSIDTQFWLVKPNISVTGVSGLETLVSGNYIGIRPVAGDLARYFTALAKAPPMDELTPGLNIRLQANDLGSLDRGSPVYYRKIAVGQVQDYVLSESDGRVVITVHIDEDYAYLVNRKTRFWNTSGLTVKASLSGITLQTESLATIVAGGIAFFSPDADAPGSQDGDVFTLHPNYDSAEVGIKATIRFSDGSGLEENATEVKYNGLKVGAVKKLNVDEPLREVIAEVVFDPHVGNLLRENTQFWLVKPTLSLSGVSGLSTLVKGNYIGLQPGDGASARKFIALEQPPSVSEQMPGLHIHVKARDLGSLNRGSPVLYKKIKVGDVQDYSLSPDGQFVLIQLFIRPAYAKQVQAQTRFWNASGIAFSAKATAVQLRTGSLSTLLAGGIEFMTPKSGRAVAARNGDVFSLYDSYEAATSGLPQPQTQKAGLQLNLLANELGSVSKGAPVYFKKIPVGEVTGYTLDRKSDQVVVQIRIQPEHTHRIHPHTRFWNASGIELKADLSGVQVKTQSISSIVSGGIAFFTPKQTLSKADSQKTGSQSVANGARFTLYEDFDSARTRNTAIDIYFASTQGLSPGAPIRYQGVDVGKVKAITLGPDSAGAHVRAVLFGSAGQLARTGSLFWVVGPQLGLVGSSNLDALIKGSRLEFLPGSGAPSLRFRGLQQAPVMRMLATGLNITLEADQLGSARRGDPVYYRQIPVGQVLDYELSVDASQVLIHINIQERYTSLVHTDSRFWNATGVKVDGGLFQGLKVTTESLEAILGGGIAFATPDVQEQATGIMVTSGQRFHLHPEPDATWLQWAPRLDVTLQP